MVNVETRNGVRDRPNPQEPLALLRALLLCQVAEQTAHAKNCREIVAGLTGEQDGDSVLDREIAEVAANRADLAVAEASHALSKLDHGTYGTCEHCGGPLPFERLEVIPHTRFCVRCAATLG
jgi:RNA polymerase-binding transcription factor DksA